MYVHIRTYVCSNIAIQTLCLKIHIIIIMHIILTLRGVATGDGCIRGVCAVGGVCVQLTLSDTALCSNTNHSAVVDGIT